MRIRFLALPALCLAVTACDRAANLNPLNYFSNPGPKPVAVIPEGGFSQDKDQRLLISQITEFKVLSSPDGAVLRAKGLPPRLGYWDAELVSTNNFKPENGVLTLEFRISEPAFRTQTGTPYQREVYVGGFISNAKMRNVRSIVVKGTTNSMSARR